MFETSGVLFSSLWLITVILCYIQHHKQKKIQLALTTTVLELEEDISAHKELIQIQMQDLTTQMSNHAALHEKLQEADQKLLELQR